MCQTRKKESLSINFIVFPLPLVWKLMYSKLLSLKNFQNKIGNFSKYKDLRLKLWALLWWQMCRCYRLVYKKKACTRCCMNAKTAFNLTGSSTLVFVKWIRQIRFKLGKVETNIDIFCLLGFKRSCEWNNKSRFPIYKAWLMKYSRWMSQICGKYLSLFISSSSIRIFSTLKPFWLISSGLDFWIICLFLVDLT